MDVEKWRLVCIVCGALFGGMSFFMAFFIGALRKRVILRTREDMRVIVALSGAWTCRVSAKIHFGESLQCN